MKKIHTLLVEDNDVATSQVDGVSSAQAGDYAWWLAWGKRPGKHVQSASSRAER